MFSDLAVLTRDVPDVLQVLGRLERRVRSNVDEASVAGEQKGDGYEGDLRQSEQQGDIATIIGPLMAHSDKVDANGIGRAGLMRTSLLLMISRKH